MPEKTDAIKIVCNGGLVSNENSLFQSEENPGSAFRLLNYEPSLYGGYRRINGYVKYNSNYPRVGGNNAEGKVLGLAIFKDSRTSEFVTIAARKDRNSNTYSFYKYNANAEWIKYDTGSTRSFTIDQKSVFRIRHDTFNFGQGNRIIFVDGVNNPIVFDGDNWTELNKGSNIEGVGPTDPNYDTSNAGGDQVLDKPSFVTVFQNHIFIGGDYEFPAVISHSSPNDPFNWNASNGAGQILSGFETTQIKPFRDSLFIFGETNIRKIVVLNNEFVIQNVTGNVGCIATDSVVEIGGDLAFLSPDGLRPVAGTSRIGDVELSSISKQIQQIMIELPNRFDLKELCSVVINQKSQIRMFFDSKETAANSSYGILGALVSGTTREISWEFSELRGIRASVATSGYINSKEVVIHGDYDGVVYQQEIGNSFDGENILSVYETPYLEISDTGQRKTFYNLSVFFRPEGPIDMNFFVNYDWGDSGIQKPLSYNDIISGGPIVYDTTDRTYDSGITYNSQISPIIKKSIEGSAFSIQTTFVTFDQNPPFSIQGFVYELKEDGRR